MNRWVVFALAACAVTAGCDDNDTTSPSSQPAVFSTILRPANEVPPIANAEANGIGAAQITLQLTRSAGGAIIGRDCRLLFPDERLSGQYDCHRRAHPSRAGRDQRPRRREHRPRRDGTVRGQRRHRGIPSDWN